MNSYIEISSDDLNSINQPLVSSPKDNNLNLNDSSEIDFPSFGEYGITKPAILFTNKKTVIQPGTEIVDLISPTKPLSPIKSSSSIPISTQQDSILLEIGSSPPLNQDSCEGSQNHSFANWDDMISEIPSLSDASPQAVNWDDMVTKVPSLGDSSPQNINWDDMVIELPALSDTSPQDANWDDMIINVPSLRDSSSQADNWDDMINEIPSLRNTYSQNTKSKEIIARLNKPKPIAEDACKQLFIKHSKDWIEENSELEISIIDSIKFMDIDLIPCNEIEIPWYLEYFMVQNFRINKNDGIFYPIAEDQYKITAMNKIILKWNAKEIIEDFDNFNWTPSKISMKATNYNCRHEKFVYKLYPKSITILITNYNQVISNLQKQSKKTFEQQMVELSQNARNDSSSSHPDKHPHASIDINSEKIQYLEQFLNYIQIKYSVNFVFMDNAIDITNYIKLFSSTVATIPFRTEPNQQSQKLNLEQLQSKKVSSISDLSNSQNCFYKQLQQIPGVTPSIAKTVVSTYPSPRHLIKAYQDALTDSEKLCLISNLSINGDSLSQSSRTRNVGNSVAQKLLKIYTSSNGNSTIL